MKKQPKTVLCVCPGYGSRKCPKGAQKRVPWGEAMNLFECEMRWRCPLCDERQVMEDNLAPGEQG